MGSYVTRLSYTLLSFFIVGCHSQSQVKQSSVASTPTNTSIQDYHDGSKNLKRHAEIDALISSIPNLKQNLTNNGLVVERIEYGTYTQDDIKNSQGFYQKGDVSYDFYSNEPQNISSCPLSRIFTIDKRGNRWIARNKTANFLMNGNCSIPLDN